MINYDLLGKSVTHYEKMGFKRIESPWLVTEEINNITCPKHVQLYHVWKNNKHKVFVGSGEQSFLYLINKGFLPVGKYQTTTPCMRNDDFDQWHTKYFMKNELINFGEVTVDDVQELMGIARDFFISILFLNEIDIKRYPLEIVKIDDNSWDINFNGIEIGSYGYRECEFTKWIYGTGLAEPRFSKVLDYVKEEIDMPKKTRVEKIIGNFEVPEEPKILFHETFSAENLVLDHFFGKQNDHGYHKKEIQKGVLGYFSKIEEEFEELKDALEQKNPVMALVELSDLLGAIEAYSMKYHNIDLDGLLTMTRATQRAFKNGHRK